MFAIVAAVSLQPDPNQIPGYNVLERLANGIGGWALIAAMIGVIVGAVMWAFGRLTTPMKFLVSRPALSS